MAVRKFVALAGLMLAGALAQAAEAPPIPEKSDLKRHEGIPAPWKDYLLQARAAERIADPLQRCLAFPDLPGNQWPAGYAQAHCRHHFAVERPTLDVIADLVERKEMVRLEEMFDQSLARHYAETGSDEGIHDTFNFLLTRKEESERIGRITESWLAQAPDSAYANLARGAYFNGAAWKARGSKYAAETPKEALRRMSELAEEAIPFLEKALSINPKLVPAYTAMIDLGMMDSRPELETKGIRGAGKLDPACLELATVRMRALKPRWGGSYEEMLAYASELSADVVRRPHLAIVIAEPYADRGDRLIADDQLTREALEVLDMAVSLGGDEVALRDAANVAFNLSDAEPDRYKGLAYLLQETRFGETNAWGKRLIAWMLVRPEPEWSLKYALSSLVEDRDSAFGHYLAGAGYFNTKRYEDADREYRVAIEDGGQRQASLREVAEMWLWKEAPRTPEARKANAAKAKPYIDQLVREYPDDGRGRIMAFHYGMAVDSRIDPADIAALRTLLKQLDRDDPWQAHHAAGFEAILKQIDAAPKQKPH